MRTAKKTRFNLETDVAGREMLERLRVQTNADSLAEVVRRSIGLMHFLLTKAESGSTILLRDDKGMVQELVLLKKPE